MDAKLQEIFDKLKGMSFSIENNVATKKITQTRQMVINDRVVNQDASLQIDVIYTGEGWVANADESNKVALFCFEIRQDKNIVDSFAIEDWDGFMKMTGKNQ